MCGRYVLATPKPELVALFDLAADNADFPPRWNIAPTTHVPIVVEPASRTDYPPIRRMESAMWGLVPTWAKDSSAAARAFNARSETAAAKPTFRTAVQSRRALVPANGWYEWKKPEGVPHFVHADTPIAFAGLYEWWRKPDGTWLLSTTILTANSIGALQPLHERMPVVLPSSMWDRWLDSETTGTQDFIDDVIVASTDVVATLHVREVHKDVGNVRNDGPELLAPIP